MTSEAHVYGEGPIYNKCITSEEPCLFYKTNVPLKVTYNDKSEFLLQGPNFNDPETAYLVLLLLHIIPELCARLLKVIEVPCLS